MGRTSGPLDGPQLDDGDVCYLPFLQTYLTTADQLSLQPQWNRYLIWTGTQRGPGWGRGTEGRVQEGGYIVLCVFTDPIWAIWKNLIIWALHNKGTKPATVCLEAFNFTGNTFLRPNSTCSFHQDVRGCIFNVELSKSLLWCVGACEGNAGGGLPILVFLLTVMTGCGLKTMRCLFKYHPDLQIINPIRVCQNIALTRAVLSCFSPQATKPPRGTTARGCKC